MIPKWLENLATGRNVSIALSVWLGFAVLFFNFGPYSSLQNMAGNALLEERFGYTQVEVKEQLDNLEEVGRATYRNFQMLDTLNAIFMAVAMTLSLVFALTRLVATGNPVRFLFILPILAGLLEIIENTLLFLLISAFPPVMTSIVGLASGVTSAKLISAFATFPITLFSLFALGVKTLYTRYKR